MYVDKLDHVDNECNKSYGTIKMRPIGVKLITYIDFGV